MNAHVNIEEVTGFLTSEKTLYLFAGVVGVISALIGSLFLLFSTHKSFAWAMLVIGILETALFFPIYINYQKKIDLKIQVYEKDSKAFLKEELVKTKQAVKSFFKVKMLYAILIVMLIIVMYKLNHSSTLYGILIALILHLAIAITVDNFGEKYSKKYLEELTRNNNV